MKKVIFGFQDPPEVAAEKVAKLRAQGKLPPAGSARQLAAPYLPKNGVTVSGVQSGIGEALKAKFESIGVTMKPGCACNSLRLRLNSMNPEQVREQIDPLTESVFKNVKDMTGLIGFIIQTAATLIPPLAKRRIRKMINECCNECVMPPKM